MSVNDQQISFAFLVTQVLRARRGLLRWGIMVGLITGGVIFAFGRVYTAHAEFIPATGGNAPGGISALAAQFGVMVGGGAGSESPQFYADVITGYRVMRRAVEAEYMVAERGLLGFRESGDTLRGTLVTLFDLDDSPERHELSVVETIERLRSAVHVRTALETGIVTLEVSLPWPDLAKQVADVLIRELQVLNVEVRQSQARAEREFVAQRLKTVRTELETSEDSLRRFLQQNRSFRESPALVLQYDELNAEVSLRRELVMSLAQAYEQARIEEVRSTPVISVLAEPRRPPRPDRRGTLVKTVAATLTVIVLGALWIMLLASFKASAGAGDADMVELTSVLGDLRADIAFRRLRRRGLNTDVDSRASRSPVVPISPDEPP